jgi:hypothetical protein
MMMNDDEYEGISMQGKPAQVTFCPPQITYDLIWA